MEKNAYAQLADTPTPPCYRDESAPDGVLVSRRARESMTRDQVARSSGGSRSGRASGKQSNTTARPRSGLWPCSDRKLSSLHEGINGGQLPTKAQPSTDTLLQATTSLSTEQCAQLQSSGPGVRREAQSRKLRSCLQRWPT